jgi:hypothetical protein
MAMFFIFVFFIVLFDYRKTTSPFRHPSKGGEILQIPLLWRGAQRVGWFLGVFTGKFSLESKCPSPDSSGNPFVPVFGSKDCNG